MTPFQVKGCDFRHRSKQHVPTQFLTKGSNFWSYFWRRGCIFDMFLGRTYSILDWRCLKYMSYVKKRARARVLDDFVLHPPLQPPLWVATLTCPGRTGASKHKCLGAMEMSTNQPSGQPVGGWEGAKTCQNSNAGSFLATEGVALDYVGRLWRDCGDATSSLRLAHRYRE